MEHFPVIIIGAGVAGLTCAAYLAQANQPFLLVEASDGIGGRVRTDRYKGYLLDRGFQIFLTDYPEARKILDYEALDLQSFRSGAIIRQDQKLMRVINPLKEPTRVFQTLFSQVGTLSDKFRILKLAAQTAGQSDEQLLQEKGTSTMAYLHAQGFSQKIISSFFVPFFGGVYLDRDLQTSSSFFRFVFKYFISSEVTLPAEGIEAIPAQLANKLPPASIRTNTAVETLTPTNELYLTNGTTLKANTVVLATSAAATARLLQQSPEQNFNQTTCTYFTADESPDTSKLLLLNTDSNSVVHNLSIPSDISASYAPIGKTLISVSTQGPHGLADENLPVKIKEELGHWFGEQVDEWRYLRTYTLPEALPPTAPIPAQPVLQLSPTLYRCGDYTAYPSLNAAMATGRQVAEAITSQKF
jgi:phytoene dehydrogenase-like protein